MPLTRPQEETLRRALTGRRKILVAELRSDLARVHGEQHAELAGEAPDAADESVAELIAEVNRADLSRDVDELQGIEAALKRLLQGTFGVCADCGVQVDLARLSASPAALRCVKCQQRHEKTYRGGETPRL